MYEVLNFIPPVQKQYERTPDFLDNLVANQYFRHERNHSFVAELIRKKFDEQKVRSV